MKKELSIIKAIYTFIVFAVVWSIIVIFLKPSIEAHFTLWAKEIVNGLIKCTVWIGFGYYCIKKYDNHMPIKYNQMLRNPIKLKVFLPFIGFVILYQLIGKVIFCGGLYFNPNFHPSRLLGAVLIAGIVEELVFRGWFYNGLSAYVSENKAIIISSVFFILIHYPRYLVETINMQELLFNSIGVFAAGLIFGWSFKKSKSLLLPIFLHMTWNALSITIGL